MSNITKLSEAQKPTVLSCSYFLHHTNEDGAAHKIKLNGEETISTICPECGREHTIDFDVFAEIVKEDGIYGTMVYCEKCTAKRGGK